MVIIGKGCVGPDIWPETPEQAENTEDMMRTTWGKEDHCRRKASGTKIYPVSPSGKEARHVCPFF